MDTVNPVTSASDILCTLGETSLCYPLRGMALDAAELAIGSSWAPRAVLWLYNHKLLNTTPTAQHAHWTLGLSIR